MSQHQALISSIALGSVAKRDVAISSSADGTMRVWDLEYRYGISGPLVGHKGSVDGVAMGRLGRRSIAVTTGDDGTIRVWDLGTGRPIGGPIGHLVTPMGEPIDGFWGGAIALGKFGSRTVAVSGGNRGELRFWDIAAGAEAAPSLAGHRGRVTAIALGQVDGRRIAVSGGEDRTIQFWDIDRHIEFGPPRTGHTDTILTVAFGEFGGRALAVSGGVDGTIRLWEPEDSSFAATIFVGSKVQTVLVTESDSVVAACDAGLMVLELRRMPAR